MKRVAPSIAGGIVALGRFQRQQDFPHKPPTPLRGWLEDVRIATHPPPRVHNGLQGQSACSSTLVILFYDHRFFFVSCIANFELGLCDIPVLYLINKSGRGKPRPDSYRKTAFCFQSEYSKNDVNYRSANACCKFRVVMFATPLRRNHSSSAGSFTVHAETPIPSFASTSISRRVTSH